MHNELTIRNINTDYEFTAFTGIMADYAKFYRQQLCFYPDQQQWRRHTVDDPDFNPELFLGIYKNGILTGAALGIVRRWKNPERGFIKFLHPFSSVLLAELEKRLFEQGIKEIHFGGSAPLYLFPGVYENDTEVMEMLSCNGWNIMSKRINRVIDFSDGTPGTANFADIANFADCSVAGDNDGVRRFALQEVSPGEEHNLRVFIEKEFSRSWALEATPIFNANGRGFCLALYDNNKIAGFAAVHASNPGWFGPMGVAPKLRGRGLGKLLARAAVIAAKHKKPELSNLLLPWINENDSFYCGIFGRMQKHVYRKAVLSRKMCR